MMERYERNFPTVSEGEFADLRTKKVAIVGAGGLGGYVLEMLVRFGIGNITIIDGDSFDKTNLNRQLLSTESNLGQKKAVVASRRASRINSDISVRAISDKLTAKNGASLLKGNDLAFDATDNIPARFAIQDACRQLEIPFVHAAVGGWMAQVCAVFPKDNTMEQIYAGVTELDPIQQTTASFAPAAAASIQVAEGIKVLTGRLNQGNYIIYLDMFSNHSQKLDMGDR